MRTLVAALARACGLLIGLLPASLLAQSLSSDDEVQRIQLGDTQIMLQAPSQHCMLNPSRPSDQNLAALVFEPRAGKLNTYLGAFVDCRSLATARSAGPDHIAMSSYGYYLAVTSTAANPIAIARNEFLQRVCDNTRTRTGTLDLTDENTGREVRAKMDALQTGRPWFGPVVAQDSNGCYQIVLFKSLVSGAETREAMLTIVTLINRRQVTFTRATPFTNDGLASFVRMVQFELAALLKLNQ
jgi:hypothetical protein